MMKPLEYKHVRAWGKMMGSFDYYITAQQEKAAKENAPIDAIYKHRDGHWEKASNLPDYHGVFNYL